MRIALEPRTDPAVLPDMGSDQRLPSAPFGRGPPSASAIEALVRAPAVGATTTPHLGRGPLTIDTQPQHHYFPGRLITRTGCALGSVLIGLAGLGGGFLIAMLTPSTRAHDVARRLDRPA